MPRPASGCCARSRSSRRRTSFRPTTSSRPTSTTSSARSSSRSTATSASSSTSTVHPFYDQLCPACGDFNFAQAHRDRRSERPRRAAHRRPRQDRLPGGDQAASRRRAPDRHDALPARLRGALRRASPTSRSGATGWRSSGSTCATRRASRRSATHLGATRDRLDFIVNNACQTVRRPPEFYRHMLERETVSAERCRRTSAAPRRVRGPAPLRELPAGWRSARAGVDARPSSRRCRSCPRISLAQSNLFPEGRLDQDLQQVDLRERNSWRLLLAEVSSVELLETQLVNAVAPFVLNARLKPLMLRTPERDKHIVNVSAVEGQFYRRFKTTRHPHTNMAKAALNMMTRTSAADYHADGHPHEQRRHRLGDRRGSRCTSRSARPPSTASSRRSTSSTVPRASSIRSSTASTPASTSGGSS